MVSPHYSALIVSTPVVVTGVGATEHEDFSLQLSHALTARGVATTVLECEELAENCRHQPLSSESFSSHSSLKKVLFEMIERDTPSILFLNIGESLSASPTESDFLSELRPGCGQHSFLVGLKFGPGFKDRDSVHAALQQIKLNRFNLCVTGSLPEPSQADAAMSAVLVTPEGGAIELTGTRAHLATELVDFCLKRGDVHWFKTTMLNEGVPEGENPVLDLAAELLQTAQDAHLLCDTSGNISARIMGSEETLRFAVTPRQKDKSSIGRSEITLVEVDPVEREIACYGPNKSSIDTGVQGVLYKHLPQIEAFLHFHPREVLLLPDARTTFPYPCGTLEEADEILTAIAKARIEKRYAGESFLIELVEHGYLIGLEKGGVHRFSTEWATAKASYEQHLIDIGEQGVGPDITLTPVLIGASVAGIIGRHVDGWHTLWLDERFRKYGYGKTFVQEIIRRAYIIGAHDQCGVLDYYTAYGYQPIERRGKISILRPPSLHEEGKGK